MLKSKLIDCRPKRFGLFFVTLAVAAVFGARCGTVHAQITQTKTVAVITTDHGEMLIEFWDDVAPKTVENFKKLANEKFYDGTAFHRIIDGFMVQGGDPLTRDEARKGDWGTGGPGYMIEAEFSKREHVRGVISMARSQDPDSAGSQFFICVADAKFLDGQYTAFGKLVAGDDVLEKLAKTEVAMSATGEKSSPVGRVNVVSIRIEDRQIETSDK
jgi:peptidyl-prolyl cis-trans isomerase B (cyclophilin B)